jgi:hypothetical protein
VSALPFGSRIAIQKDVSFLTAIVGREYATNRMSHRWLKALPTAILALFLLGFPCRSLMANVVVSGHECCEHDTGKTHGPSQGCQTLCAASARHVLLQSGDDPTTGIPCDAGIVPLVVGDLALQLVEVAEPATPDSVSSPPLYLQNSSLLI